MKRAIVFLALLMLAFDLADCTLLGQASYPGDLTLNSSAPFLPSPFYQHIKELPEKDDSPSHRSTLFASHEDIRALPDRKVALPSLLVISTLPKENPFSQLSSSGGIPW
ncbi:MAG: hypothetical protein WHT07_03010 [Desulfobaccales bacterium]